jgi:hypothetical protein
MCSLYRMVVFPAASKPSITTCNATRQRRHQQHCIYLLRRSQAASGLRLIQGQRRCKPFVLQHLPACPGCPTSCQRASSGNCPWLRRVCERPVPQVVQSDYGQEARSNLLRTCPRTVSLLLTVEPDGFCVPAAVYDDQSMLLRMSYCSAEQGSQGLPEQIGHSVTPAISRGCSPPLVQCVYVNQIVGFEIQRQP